MTVSRWLLQHPYATMCEDEIVEAPTAAEARRVWARSKVEAYNGGGDWSDLEAAFASYLKQARHATFHRIDERRWRCAHWCHRIIQQAGERALRDGDTAELWERVHQLQRRLNRHKRCPEYTGVLK